MKRDTAGFKQKKETQVVQQMIALYCRGRHKMPKSCARIAWHWRNMRPSVWRIARIKRQKPFALTVKRIATSRRCARRSAR